MKDSIKKSDVQLLLKRRIDFKTQSFLFKSRDTSLQNHRIAFAFSRHSGNSVMRNRFKRRVRELVRKFQPKGNGKDYLCIARQPLGKITREIWMKEKDLIKEKLK